jgi:predicted RNase H-like HicB family nuclease
MQRKAENAPVRFLCIPLRASASPRLCVNLTPSQTASETAELIYPEVRRVFLTQLLALLEIVDLPKIPAICRDPADDKVLATALWGAVDYLVTADGDLTTHSIVQIRIGSCSGQEAAIVQRCTIQAVIYPGDTSGYVAECLNLAIVTQGRTLDDTVQNLREAIQLHLAGEDLREHTVRCKAYVHSNARPSASTSTSRSASVLYPCTEMRTACRPCQAMPGISMR